jgi:hypothetical protein
MLVWPSSPSLLEGDGREGCHYQLAYSYELLECAQEPLVLASDTAVIPLAAPDSPPDSWMGAGARGFFWLTDGDLQKSIERSVATFRMGDESLLEWRIVPE